MRGGAARARARDRGWSHGQAGQPREAGPGSACKGHAACVHQADSSQRTLTVAASTVRDSLTVEDPPPQACARHVL